MSKLLSALVATGFALGLSAVVAQNVDSDKDKARGQEQIMQDKEGAGAGQSQSSQTQSQTSPSADTKGSSTAKPNDGQTRGQSPMRNRYYSQMRERCSTMTGEQREQCLSNARSQYLTSAASRCERLTDASMKQQCFNDVQGAVGLPTTGRAASSTDASTAGTQGSQDDAVKRGEDEDKPGRQ
jgi:hypothetical protein